MNSQLAKLAKLRRYARKVGARRSDDPDGTIGTLQGARRLVQDEGLAPSEALLEASNKYAAPIDSGRAFWAAHYALMMAGASGWLTLSAMDDAEIDVLLPIFDSAIHSQGQMNIARKAHDDT